uniref:DUF4604 domain-containing protein n=1 Tax=Meloidogyne hapla TaxID=6305 RepID=A0A1I8B6Z8_MELHA
MPAKEKERSAEAKKGKKNGSNDKTPKASTLAKLKEKKDEKETPTALSSEHQSDNEGPPKSKTKTTGGIFTNSDNSTPTAIMPIVGEFGGERKVSAVLTALTEKEKKEAEKKFPMEEDIDDHPDYDTLQYADKKDVFKTGFTSKGVRIEKEEPKMKLRPGDSAYLDD